MITTYIQIIQKYIKLYQKYPQNIAFLDNIARNDKRLRKNQSSPRRLVGSCQGPVPWQGWQLHHFFSTFSIPSTSCSTRSTLSRSFELASLEKGPSLHSKMTLFGSSGSIVCHTPFGMFTPYRPSSLHSTTSSIIEPSSLCVVTLTFPRRITNVSSFVGCLCIGTSVPGSTAFKNRWHFSSRL